MKIKGYTYFPLTTSDVGKAAIKGYVYSSGASAYSRFFPIAKWNVDGSETQIFRPATIEEVK